MAFRIRRYRLVLGVSLLLIATIYHLTRFNTWEVPVLDQLTSLRSKSDFLDNEAEQAPRIVATLPTAFVRVQAESTTSLEDFPAPTQALDQTTSVSTSHPISTTSSSAPASNTWPLLPLLRDEEQLVQVGQKPPQAIKKLPQDLVVPYGHGRVEIEQPPDGEVKVAVHWEPQVEHYPVLEEDLTRLPTGKAQRFSSFQFDFAPESPAEQADRLQKLGTIKAAFRHAWSGYRDNAIGHDELRPVSGKYANPFNGWGATLVDSLDTLWIMDLKEEFDEAVTWVKKIDFTTSVREDIPVFETTIRYLGGLVSAFDLSGGKYSVLLDKAVELADIIMGAFDTPNRMPDTYYLWAPADASQPHRAKTRVVLAELGSLALEFTRIAQLTKEDKYYDAIARITDALEAWQMNTIMPGLWPLAVDASGCKMTNSSSVPSLQPHFSTLVGSEAAGLGLDGSEVRVQVPEIMADDSEEPAEAVKASSQHQSIRRQLNDADPSVADIEHVWTQHPPNPVNAGSEAELAVTPELASLKAETDAATVTVDCEPQGLAEEPRAKRQTFGIGAQADSTYEYFPKEYLLLGGQAEQYKSMYQDAANVIRKELLFRPMNPEEKDILFVGKINFDRRGDDSWSRTMIYEGAHLSCFAGGMFALGSKAFGMPGDLDIARKLTEGCVWAYESTTTGIMPEEFAVVPCESRTNCKWNSTKWYDILDTNEQSRVEATERWNKNQKFYFDQSLAEAAKAKAAAKVAAEAEAEKATEEVPQTLQNVDTASTDTPSVDTVSVNTASVDTASERPVTPKVVTADTLYKRQLVYASEFGSEGPTRTTTHSDSVDDANESAPEEAMPVFTPRRALSHKEFAESRIKEERLPPGFTFFQSRHYGLRPEAIESVWIMYRLTGEGYWRRKGWDMFTAIQSNTLTELGNSMISDVTSEVPLALDTMESFWLAETLKYFYLLFSEPSVISLDDYVLNTEAHPFKRPK